VTRTEVSDVVSDEEARSCANGCGEDGHVLHVGECARSLTVLRCRTVDLERDGSKELAEERSGLRELRGQIPSDLVHGSLGNHQSKEAELTEYQDRVAGARAGQQAGDQDVRVDTDG
jgi:hypothetical protein